MINRFTQWNGDFLTIQCDEPGCLTSTRNMGAYIGSVSYMHALLLWRDHGGSESTDKQQHYCRIHKSSNKD